ncbi:MAG: hypothetical protein J0M33_16255 [Anaerolineae bacterium]|nr:hypothetical protein [Anaerolineae bacterium]
MSEKPSAGRILLKAGGLFILINVIFAVVQPLEAIGSLSIYNGLIPGRPRLPYGENPAQSYNLSTNNLPAMIASHILHQPKAADEYRILLIGDSSVWGWRLTNDQTLAARLSAAGLIMPDGRRAVIHNLGYPVMALMKDLLLLDAVMAYQPDAILWPLTLESFARERQLFHPLVQNNTERVQRLIADHSLLLDPSDTRLVNLDFFGRTLVGQRRELANWLRLQFYGASWAATGIDQFIPMEFTPRSTDLEADVTWQAFESPQSLTEADLAFDVLRAGITRVGNIPVLLVNEPIYISDGTNSDIRYNAWYPRWAYDAYRALLATTAESEGWDYLDLWDTVEGAQFTDSPVHMTPDATARTAARIATWLQSFTEQ